MQSNEQSFSETEIVASYAKDFYWRSDEENACKLLPMGKLFIGGVGAGRTIGPLARRGYSIIAADISKDMVEAAQKAHPGVDIRVLDIQRTEFADNTFDGIFLPFHTISYTDSPWETVAEMRRILKPGGVLVFSMPNRFFAGSIMYPATWARRTRNHVSRQTDVMVTTWQSSVFDAFSFHARVIPRIRLQNLPFASANWKDKLLKLLPFLDKTLYFVCKK